MDANWITVFSAPEYFKVEVVKSFLEEHGVDGYIMERPDSAYVMLGEAQLLVPTNQADTATNLLQGRDF